ncbi:hypothetical protein THAOC_13723, partial [Thalassiosira oceanica]
VVKLSTKLKLAVGLRAGPDAQPGPEDWFKTQEHTTIGTELHRLIMHKFAATPASLNKVGRRAIGIALRPQDFKGDVLLGMRIGAMVAVIAVIGPPGEAMEELD